MSAESPPSREILRTRMLNWFAASAKISGIERKQLLTAIANSYYSFLIDEPLPRWSRGPALTRGPGTLTSQILFRDNCGTSNRVPSARKDGIAVFRHPIGIAPRM